MLLSDIKIYPAFWETQPGHDKMEQKRRYLEDNGTLQSEIVLDDDGYLIDGSTSYLLAGERGIMDVPVRRGKRQAIQAYHRPDGKLYTWRLPEGLTDKVSAGDRVLVHTQQGVRCVTVAAVERYIPQNGTGQLRMAIRRKGGSVCQ